MCTFERRKVFEEGAIVQSVTDQLLTTCTAYGVAISAYCFMPDHLHALLEGLTDASDLRKCAAMFRQRTGRDFKLAGRRHRLWQEGFYDHVLRNEDASLEVARYIAGNPVRAELCRDAREYAYIGSTLYTVDELVQSTMWRPFS